MKKSLALLLALTMIMALAACGGSSATETAAAPAEAPAAEAAAPAAPAEAAAAPDAAAPAANAEVPAAPDAAPTYDASGEPSGAPSGDPPAGTHPDAELMEPTADYSKDLAGYKAYAIDALQTDPNAPAVSVPEMIANIEAATDPSDDAFRKLSDPGRILTYEDFLAF